MLMLHCLLVLGIDHLTSLAFLCLGSLALIASLPFSLSLLLRGYLPFLFLLSFTFLLHFIQGQSELIGTETILFSWGSFFATYEGLLKGGLYTTRILAILLASSLMTLSTPSVEITYGLDRLLRPLKRLGFPSEEFALMMSISLRFIPVLFEELSKIRRAQEARGASLWKGSLSRRMTTLSAIFIPLLHQTLARADNLATAMEVRGFDPARPRTSLKSFKLQTSDLAAWVLYTSVMLLLFSKS